MAELHVDWADGRREVHEVRYAGKIIAIGDSLLSYNIVELGRPVCMGGKYIPWLRVRVHGDEMPFMVLLTAARCADQLVLPKR